MRYLALAAGLWIALAALVATGFCIPDFAWKSDRELYERAFQFIREKRLPQAIYQNLDELISDDPACCSIGAHNERRDDSAMNALFFRNFFAVRLKYKTSSPSTDGKTGYEAIMIMDCCARYVPDHYGADF